MVLIIPFCVPQLPDQELLCQADMALTKVTRCKEVYEPLITNLKRLHGKKVSRGCTSPLVLCSTALAPWCLCPHTEGTTGLIRICSLEMGPELGIANLPVLQDNLPLPISPHQPQPLQTSGHGGHTAGHRGQTLVLSKGQFLRSRASILTTLSYLLHYLCGNGGK